ncbi:MAG: alcohol dehydrogenase, partial [Chloroflexota bacterium]
MKALQYRFSIPNYLAARAADRLPLPILDSGRIPGLSEITLTSRPLPGPDWLRLRPRLCGVCGSDISMLLNRSSPALSPFVSFPVVPGHEVVADVVETGSQVGDIVPGQRVVVNPLISCAMRGLPPCRWCATGEPGLCTSSAEGALAPGM